MIGTVAAILSILCFGVVLNDLLRRRTVFAQCHATLARRPGTYWLAMAGWIACFVGSLLVSMVEKADPACNGAEKCIVVVGRSQ